MLAVADLQIPRFQRVFVRSILLWISVSHSLSQEDHGKLDVILQTLNPSELFLLQYCWLFHRLGNDCVIFLPHNIQTADSYFVNTILFTIAVHSRVGLVCFGVYNYFATLFFFYCWGLSLASTWRGAVSVHSYPSLAGLVSGRGSAEQVQGSRASHSGLDSGDQPALPGLRLSQTTNPFFLCKIERPLIKICI